jgi:hypothetical protein
MSETDFTPGPWRVEREGHECWVRDDGGLIARGPFPNRYENEDERFYSELDQYYANAALIAAAPDLYEALRDLCEMGGLDDGGCVIEKGMAALKKARGEA